MVHVLHNSLCTADASRRYMNDVSGKSDHNVIAALADQPKRVNS